MLTTCPFCNSQDIFRAKRYFGEKLRRIPSVWKCRGCGRRVLEKREKRCWRCGSDLDRRHRSQNFDFVMALLLLRPYSCRRCATRRYRWG